MKKIFQPASNIPNFRDNGEEAVAALRVLQGESSAISDFLLSVPNAALKGLIASSLLADFESPAVTLLDDLYATPYGLSFDASHVIDTQAVNGLVEAPGTGSYMLIGAQFATIADPSVTGGF